MSMDLIGPGFANYHVVVDGYRVPKMEAYPVVGGPEDGDTFNFVLDERFLVEASREEAQRWMWIVANAMAIGAGFTCHGANSRPSNEYAVQVREIGFVETATEEAPRE